METTVQFPVDYGTVVEITCSDLDAVNTGSKLLTCVYGMDYSFELEPSCSLCDIGKQPDPDKTSCSKSFSMSFSI